MAEVRQAVRGEREESVQGLGPGPHDAAPQEQQKCGRRGAEGGRGESSPQVWTLRVPDGDGNAGGRRVGW